MEDSSTTVGLLFIDGEEVAGSSFKSLDNSENVTGDSVSGTTSFLTVLKDWSAGCETSPGLLPSRGRDSKFAEVDEIEAAVVAFSAGEVSSLLSTPVSETETPVVP